MPLYRDYRVWLSGAETECPFCKEQVEEGSDCSNKHYQEYHLLTRDGMSPEHALEQLKENAEA